MSGQSVRETAAAFGVTIDEVDRICMAETRARMRPEALSGELGMIVAELETARRVFYRLMITGDHDACQSYDRMTSRLCAVVRLSAAPHSTIR